MGWTDWIGPAASAIGNVFHHPNDERPADTPDKVDGASSGTNWGSILQGIFSPAGKTSLGKGLGAVAQADATNRGAKLAAMMAGDQMKLQEQSQRNQDLATLPGQIQKADYLAHGGYKPAPLVSSSGRAIPHFDLGLAPISSNVQSAGRTLEGQLTNRLNTPPTYNNYSSVMNPSKTETALNWLSPILTASGASDMAQNDPYTKLIAALTAQSKNTPTTPPPAAPSAPPPTTAPTPISLPMPSNIFGATGTQQFSLPMPSNIFGATGTQQ